MINLLIADDNINYAINLMNYIHKKNKNIRVSNITKDGSETINVLNSHNDIDIVVLDYNMPFYNGEQVLNMIQRKEAYKSSCVIISGEINTIQSIKENELVDAVIYKGTTIEKIIEKIDDLIEIKTKYKEGKLLRNRIIEEISFLSYDIAHKGTNYLIHTIEYMIKNNCYEGANLEKKIYPEIAKIYNESIHNIKSRINRATETMYYNCDSNKLKKYFSFQIEQKPKIKTVINTIINKKNN